MIFLTGREPGLPGLRGPMGRRAREDGGERARWTSIVGVLAHGHGGQRETVRLRGTWRSGREQRVGVYSLERSDSSLGSTP